MLLLPLEMRGGGGKVSRTQWRSPRLHQIFPSMMPRWNWPHSRRYHMWSIYLWHVLDVSQ